VSVTDPNGATTTTAHTASPYHALPSETTVTNALGHTRTTVWSRLHRAPLRETDANGNLTSYGYDGLGRLRTVRLPTEQPQEDGKAPSWQFDYLISDDYSTLPRIRSWQLTSQATSGPGVVMDQSWVIYDKLGREWQNQQRSPETGKVLVTSTIYDDRGLVEGQNVLDAVSGTPGNLVVVPAWDNATRTTYDELGRPVREEWLRDGDVARTTETEYGIDTVTVTGPDGGQVRETVDGLGRAVEVAEHDGTNWVTGSYGYDLADNLVSVTDPVGNQATYSYNLAGWRLGQDDPDRGSASFGYDRAGNQTVATDAAGNTVHTAYDPLGRAVERRAGAVDGPLLASWAYDAPGEVGLLDAETRHSAEGEWVNDVAGYDGRNRALGSTTIVPEGIPGLSGSYTTSQTFDRADRVTSVTYPAAGDLPEETVTTSYSDLGLPTGLSGLDPYVRATTYDDRGRLTAAALGPENAGGGVWMGRNWTYDVDQRLSATETYVAGSALPDGIVGRHQISYDAIGNVSEQVNSLNGSDWRECYEHDQRQRLLWAFTVESGDTCAEGQKGTGDQPYENRFLYTLDGNIVARSEAIDPEVGDLILYGYPASGADRPHAPDTVGDDSYTWDANGNLTERTAEGVTETYSWDTEQHLASVAGSEGTTSFVYDAGGQRLLRRTDTDATLYVAGHEITANADGSSVTAVRSYSFEGQLIATRTPDGLSYVLTDGAGSVEMAVESGGQPTATRLYEPYGRVRADDGEMDTDQGFAGQVEDSSTGLSYLQNRYYDTGSPMFLSPDPLYDTGNIKSLNPYSYGAGNPTTFSDPEGLSPTYIHGLQVQNMALTAQNKQLRGHIKQLGSHIEGLQNIIRKQNRTINKLITRVKALEGIIRQQQSIIQRLVNRVNYLVGVVNYQRVVIGRLQAKIAYQQRIINAQASRIRNLEGQVAYYKGVVNQLGFRLWGGTAVHGLVMANIHYGKGIPKGAFGLDNVSFYQGQATALRGEVSTLQSGMDGLHTWYSARLQDKDSAIANLKDENLDLWLDAWIAREAASPEPPPDQNPGWKEWGGWALAADELLGIASWGMEGWNMWADTHEDKPWAYCQGQIQSFSNDQCQSWYTLQWRP
jgi:RHS repeat-associated protein